MKPPQKAGPLKFSTRGLPQVACAQALRDLYEQVVLPGKLEPLEPLPGCAVHVDIVKWVLPGAAFMSGTLAGVCQTVRSRSSAATNEDDVLLGINLRGKSVAISADQEFGLDSGDAFLATRGSSSINVARSTAVRFMGFRFPRDAVRPGGARLGSGQFRVIRRGSQALNLLAAYAQTVGNGEFFASPELRGPIATHIADLIGAAIETTPDGRALADTPSIRAARMKSIMADIAANIATPDFSIEMLATRQRVTARYIQRLFEGEGMTFSAFVRERRLFQAYRMLIDARFGDRSISSIAFDVGFGDLSYFNRVFRQRYDATPSEVRHRSEADGGKEAQLPS